MRIFSFQTSYIVDFIVKEDVFTVRMRSGQVRNDNGHEVKLQYSCFKFLYVLVGIKQSIRGLKSVVSTYLSNA